MPSGSFDPTPPDTDDPTQWIVPIPAIAWEHSTVGKKSAVLALQRAMMVLALRKDTEDKLRPPSARTWCDLQEVKRVLDDKLKAGSYNAHTKGIPEKKQKQSKAGALVTYPGPSVNSAPAVVNDSSCAVTPTSPCGQSDPEITLAPQVSQDSSI